MNEIRLINTADAVSLLPEKLGRWARPAAQEDAHIRQEHMSKKPAANSKNAALEAVWVADVDVSTVAKIATSAYDGQRNFLTPARLSWAYEKSFGGDTRFVQLNVDGQTVGHAAIFIQEVSAGPAKRKVAQLADLFLAGEYKNFKNVRRMYAKMQTILDQGEFDAVVTMPNARAIRLNNRFLGLENIRRLAFRGGLVTPALRATGSGISTANISHTRLASLLEPFLRDQRDSEIVWTPEDLANRLQPPNHKPGSGPLAVHTGKSAALITSRNIFHGIPYILVWGVLGQQDEIDMDEVDALLRTASRNHGSVLFTYAGVNDRLPRPLGHPLPEKMRPSPLTVQGGTYDGKGPLSLKRYELIDFDFA